MNNITVFVDNEFEGERIDKFLSVIFPECSRSLIQKTIDNGNVTVNSKVIT
ncbi:MAG: S4 domain-containing protein, partial [Oscillospiraceae bacterium]